MWVARLVLVVVSLAVGVAVGTSYAASTAAQLIATSRPCTINSAVGGNRRLHAGWYRITVRDESTHRYFALTGDGVGKRTTESFVGTRIWRVYLRPGTYHYACGRRPSLKGAIRIG
jgi:hypothetical protein